MVQAIKRVAIYCRVSTNDQNCERQERDLIAFAERAGFEVIHLFKEVASGMKNDRLHRQQVIQLAQARKIDAVLVTEMTRWGRSLQDLITTMNELNAYGVSLIAEKGMQFDLSTPQGKMLAGVLGSLAEFERDMIAERTRSGLANARAKGRIGGRRKGDNPSDKHADQFMDLLADGRQIRWIAHELQISKTTVMAIKKRLSA